MGLSIAHTRASSSTKYHIIIATPDIAISEETVAALKVKFPNTASTFSIIEIDESSPTSVAAAVRRVELGYGKLDDLINSNGISNEAPNLPLTTAKCVTDNVLGPALVTDSFLHLLIKGDQPCLFFISSVFDDVAPQPHSTDCFHRQYTPGFKVSQAALSMLMTCYHEKLKGGSVELYGACPTYLEEENSAPVYVKRSRGVFESWDGAELGNKTCLWAWDGAIGRLYTSPSSDVVL